MAKETEKKKTTKVTPKKGKTVKNNSSHDEKRTLPAKREVAKNKAENNKVQKGGKKRGEQVRAFEEAPANKKPIHQIMPFVLMILALFLAVCFVLIDLFHIRDSAKVVGTAGGFVRDIMCGLFGYAAFATPVVLGFLAIGWHRAIETGKLIAKNLYGLTFMITFSTLVHGVSRIVGYETGSSVVSLYRSGEALVGGGAVGGLLGNPMSTLLGAVGFPLVFAPIAFVFFVFLMGLTPHYVITSIRYRVKLAAEKQSENAKVRREEKAIEREEAKKEREAERAAAAERRELEKRELELKKKQLAEAEAEAEKARKKQEEERAAQEKRAREEAERLEKEKARKMEELHAEEQTPKPSDEDGVYVSAEEMLARHFEEPKAEEAIPVPEEEGEEYSLHEIFADEKKSTVAKNHASEADMALLGELKPIEDLETVPEGEDDGIVEIVTDVPEPKAYEFPPIELLSPDTNPKQEDISAELKGNAQKLVDTLRSFKVGVEDINYSRGPTITRYEIKPAVGVRVRAIANLVDDIALSLATTGVRIEAPIPNKPAVGVEVPNQNPATVFLRSLIDTDKFANENSRLTACLGADVGGNPIYFNIAKMPHLLIAGATGMGKSVCINSIIVSLLYKARPDEVKLILIDPKKVEFNIYKDIPHLYAPIVSEPTKAAGALASAVAEMERRFELIEEVGVRDIYNYNAVTKDDPDREFMPQMVIIIDELADLMMTAADSVESSICRLAQKARAAGIHIIIGTQRPSVDVITGLIKANIPSRIAFTVASQVDSRTIIDIAGAEKLIGRGDMLFAPVGAAKPMRVQGAFVHESEVEKIVEFIKANNMAAKYNEDFVNRIEEEAAKCANGKKGGGAEGGGDLSTDGLDPKFRAAVEVAVDNGRIATSLLQRKLEIGYGRAAKIIDQMEEMGYISAPDGNKPRKVLISKEDFMQMVVNNEIE